MEVDNAVGETYIPETPVEKADSPVAPVVFSEEIEIPSVSTKSAGIKKAGQGLDAPMPEPVRFVPESPVVDTARLSPGIAPKESPPINAEGNAPPELDPNSVKAKLRAKLQKKSEEAKLMKEMERSFAEMNDTDEIEIIDVEGPPLKRQKLDSFDTSLEDVKPDITQMQNIVDSGGKNNIVIDEGQYETVSKAVPKHTTDDNQDL